MAGFIFAFMYSREEAARIRQEFWTSFGKYMAPVPAASGQKVNWINYKTGIRHIYVRSNADRDFASCALEITHPDRVVQQLYFEQLISYRQLLPRQEVWIWNDADLSEQGKTVCSIKQHIGGVNIYRVQDWPAIISFLKPCLMELDAYWDIVKELIEVL